MMARPSGEGQLPWDDLVEFPPIEWGEDNPVIEETFGGAGIPDRVVADVERLARELGIDIEVGESLIDESVEKHLSGQHDQARHAGGGGSRTGAIWSAGSVVDPVTGNTLTKTDVGDTFELMTVSKINQSPEMQAALGGRLRSNLSGGRQGAIDLVSDDLAIELKAVNGRSSDPKIGIKRAEVEAKEAAAVALGKRGAVVAPVYDAESGSVAVFMFDGGFRPEGAATGAFRPTRPTTPMRKVGEFGVTAQEFGDFLRQARSARGADPETGRVSKAVDQDGEKIEEGDVLIVVRDGRAFLTEAG